MAQWSAAVVALFLSASGGWAQDRFEVFEGALTLLAEGDSEAARAAAAPLGGDLDGAIDWMILRSGEAPFEEYLAFFAENPHWPETRVLRRRAERAIPDDYPSLEVARFFTTELPLTGEGVVALARALEDLGETEAARRLVQDAWLEMRMDEEPFEALLETYGEMLAPLHGRRVDYMIWRYRWDEAERLLDRLPSDLAALSRARIALSRNRGDVAALLDAVPEPLRTHPGLLQARFIWAVERGRMNQAAQLVLAASTSAEALGEPLRWTGHRRQLARWLMRNGEPDMAYAVASAHFMEDGFPFVDLEWLSGYLALRYLEDPQRALVHFSRLVENGVTPIELGRAHYWVGRAEEALGRDPTASFRAGGQWQTSFYGLLAAERAGLSLDPTLVGPVGDWESADWADDPLFEAARFLARAGERSRAETLFAHLSEDMDEADLLDLADLLAEIRAPHIAVRVGKMAVERGIVVNSVYFPLHPLADFEMDIDPSLALAVARRESEFDPVVASPVGAQGLMQLMPATAEEVSGWLGLSYSRGRLTADEAYNARLGIRYLEFLQEEFGPTPVMIAAGYNAGPSRPSTWAGDRGDPRLGEVDVVDWIEHIPFRETRNYVMRVTESMPVYRARLGRQTQGPVSFTPLLVGEKPLVRPVARPGSERVTSPRPVARP